MSVRDHLSPEMLAALDRDEELKSVCPADGPEDLDAYRRQYNFAREFWNQGGPEMSTTRNFNFKSGHVSIPCRLYCPEDPAKKSGEMPVPAIIYLHGGGWVVGNLDTHDRVMRELAHRSKYNVLGIDYPLAPETTYPESYQHVLTAILKFLDSEKSTGGSHTPFLLAGDSAGAHMSLHCAIQLRDMGGPAPEALILFYGAFGLTHSNSRIEQGNHAYGLTTKSMDYYIAALMGSGSMSEYDLLGQELSGLPPTLITSCTLDPLKDDSTVLAERLDASGVVHELIEFDKVLHGYLSMVQHLPDASDTLEAGARWAREYVSGRFTIEI